MEIRKATIQDMEKILNIYETARAFMAESGNPNQWGNSYPPTKLVETDIKQGISYVCVEDKVIHGVFTFFIGEDATYQSIENGKWKNDAPYGVIHRVASDGTCRGIISACKEFCEAQIGNLKIDTHHDNHVMQHALEKHGFEKCGIIYTEDNSPRIAYQYVKQIFS